MKKPPGLVFLVVRGERSLHPKALTSEEPEVHRDVKPENILLHGLSRAVLADFGQACFLADTRSMTQRARGPTVHSRGSSLQSFT